MGAAGQRRACSRQHGISRGAGEQVAAGPQVAVQLGLDGVQQLGNMLELVYADRLGRPGREQRRVGRDRPPGLDIVEIYHRNAMSTRACGEQRALPDGPGPREDDDRLLTEALGNHRLEVPCDQVSVARSDHASWSGDTTVSLADNIRSVAGKMRRLSAQNAETVGQKMRRLSKTRRTPEGRR